MSMHSLAVAGGLEFCSGTAAEWQGGPATSTATARQQALYMHIDATEGIICCRAHA